MFRYQGEERGIQAYYKPSSSPSVHGFLGAAELDRPLDSLWNIICQLSKSHMYNQSVRSVWTRPLDDSTQLGELIMCLLSLFPHRVCLHYSTSDGMKVQELDIGTNLIQVFPFYASLHFCSATSQNSTTFILQLLLLLILCITVK